MSQNRDIEIATGSALLRFLAFCIFFSTGTIAVVLAIMAEEIRDYYQQRQIPRKIEKTNQKIRALTSDYEEQIAKIKEDPSILGNLKKITFETENPTEGLPSTQASSSMFATARQALQKNVDTQMQTDPIPEWLERSCESKTRKTILIAGMGLLLITFIFFGSESRRKAPKLRN